MHNAEILENCFDTAFFYPINLLGFLTCVNLKFEACYTKAVFITSEDGKDKYSDTWMSCTFEVGPQSNDCLANSSFQIPMLPFENRNTFYYPFFPL